MGEPRKSYWGERSFPLILQNVHRYFLYLALVFIVLLAHDAWKAMWFNGEFGFGLGTLVMIDQSHSAGRLHAGVPFAAALGRRAARSDVKKAGSETGLRLRVVSESQTYVVGVDELVLGRIHGRLYTDMLDGNLA